MPRPQQYQQTSNPQADAFFNLIGESKANAPQGRQGRMLSLLQSGGDYAKNVSPPPQPTSNMFNPGTWLDTIVGGLARITQPNHPLYQYQSGGGDGVPVRRSSNVVNTEQILKGYEALQQGSNGLESGGVIGVGAGNGTSPVQAPRGNWEQAAALMKIMPKRNQPQVSQETSDSPMPVIEESSGNIIPEGQPPSMVDPATGETKYYYPDDMVGSVDGYASTQQGPFQGPPSYQAQNNPMLQLQMEIEQMKAAGIDPSVIGSSKAQNAAVDRADIAYPESVTKGAGIPRILQELERQRQWEVNPGGKEKFGRFLDAALGGIPEGAFGDSTMGSILQGAAGGYGAYRGSNEKRIGRANQLGLTGAELGADQDMYAAQRARGEQIAQNIDPEAVQKESQIGVLLDLYRDAMDRNARGEEQKWRQDQAEREFNWRRELKLLEQKHRMQNQGQGRAEYGPSERDYEKALVKAMQTGSPEDIMSARLLEQQQGREPFDFEGFKARFPSQAQKKEPGMIQNIINKLFGSGAPETEPQ